VALGLDLAKVLELQHQGSLFGLQTSTRNRDRGDPVEDHLARVDCCVHTSNLEVATDTKF